MRRNVNASGLISRVHCSQRLMARRNLGEPSVEARQLCGWLARVSNGKTLVATGRTYRG